MKKLILTTLAAGCLTLSAFSQGAVYVTSGFLADNGGVTSQDAQATDVNNATTWLNQSGAGAVSWQLLYASLSVGASNAAVSADALNNVAGGSVTALSILNTAGYALAASGNGTVNYGAFTATTSTTGSVNGSGQVLLPTVPTSVNAYLALVITDTATGVNNGWTGVLAFLNNTGGNPLGTPPGTGADLTGWNALNANLVISPVPEPTTLALGALGGLSLLLFRRKQS